MNEARDFVDLLSVGKMTETRLFLLLEKFRTPATVKRASVDELATVVGMEVALAIARLKVDDHVARKYERMEKLGIRVLPYYDPAFPSWLRQINHFPPVLFIRGEIKPEDETAIAVIGTRGATVYGKGIADRFAAEFARSGVTVVSGMARGIDTAAHRSALKNQGRTIAVLGCGLDEPYPPENRELMEGIVRSGAAVSEFNIGTPPLAQNFPKRNRIISGLARAIVAIEAKEKSGVMNTVNWAASQGRDVFAIPGNIYSQASSGTNRLIKEGAIPATSAAEILEALGLKHAQKERIVREIFLSGEEKELWAILSGDPVYLDELAEKSNRSTADILKVLLSLEIKGVVRQLPGMMFVKNLDELR
jgi:DNA processing protein